jgi:hypothetical protein
MHCSKTKNNSPISHGVKRIPKKKPVIRTGIRTGNQNKRQPPDMSWSKSNGRENYNRRRKKVSNKHKLRMKGSEVIKR